MKISHKLLFIALGASLFISAWIGRLAITEHNNRVRAELTTETQSKDIRAASATIDSLQKGIVLRNSIEKKNRVRIVTLIRTVQTPTEIISSLPEIINLPVAPTLQPGTNALVIPQRDDKPLFDVLANCKQDSSSLVTCREDYATMIRENEEKDKQFSSETAIANGWKRAASGGSVVHRILNDSKYLAIGAAAGFVASRVAH